jgi:hypothetical protein
MHIAGTPTAFPPYYFSQQKVVEALKTYWGNGPDNGAVLDLSLAKIAICC